MSADSPISLDVASAARWAKLAYGQPETAVSWSNRLLTLRTFVGNGTVAVHAHDGETAVVAFRGTEFTSFQDWRANFDRELVPGGWAGSEVHSGWAHGLDAVWNGPKGLLRTMAENRHLPTLFTGHSAGGALATLAVWQLNKLDALPARFALHTFGSPRVGDADFVKLFNRRFLEHSHRWVACGDPVPMVPAKLPWPLSWFLPSSVGAYRHVGQERWIDAGGRIDPVQTSRLAQSAKYLFWDSGFRPVKAALAAHDMDNYLGALTK